MTANDSSASANAVSSASADSSTASARSGNTNANANANARQRREVWESQRQPGRTRRYQLNTVAVEPPEAAAEISATSATTAKPKASLGEISVPRREVVGPTAGAHNHGDSILVPREGASRGRRDYASSDRKIPEPEQEEEEEEEEEYDQEEQETHTSVYNLGPSSSRTRRPLYPDLSSSPQSASAFDLRYHSSRHSMYDVPPPQYERNDPHASQPITPPTASVPLFAANSLPVSHNPPTASSSLPAAQPPQTPPYPYQPSYHTFPTQSSPAMGNPEGEASWLLNNPTAPQSMRGRGGESHGDRLWRRVSKKDPSALRSCVRFLLGIALIVVVSVVSIVALVRSARDVGDYIRDGSSLIGRKYRSDDTGKVIWAPGHVCLPDEHRQPSRLFEVNYSPNNNLTLIQKLNHEERESKYRPFVFGDVIFQKNNEKSNVKVEVITNDVRLNVNVVWDSISQMLVIETPGSVGWSNTLAPCVQVRVTLSVPTQAYLHMLQASTVTLDTLVNKTVNVRAYAAIFTSVSGSVEFSQGSLIDANVFSASSVSGDIKTIAPLRDMFTLGSASGDVYAQLAPQEPDHYKGNGESTTSTLKITTVSGDVFVQEDLNDDIPARSFHTTIRTRSGDVRAKLLSGTLMDIESISGTVSADLQPVLNTAPGRSCGTLIKTKTVSGTHHVNVREPLFTEFARDGPIIVLSADSIMSTDESEAMALEEMGSWLSPKLEHHVAQHDAAVSEEDGDSADANANYGYGLTCLGSVHSAVSGSINVQLPESWSGRFAAKTLSGSVSISGEGMEMDSRNRVAAGRKFRSILGHKGDGESELELNTVSGNLRVQVGE